MNEEIIQLLLSLLAGALLGIEREYKFKAAGIRTIALISVGSTLYTILSQHIGSMGNQDRIASNILTGVGFIGAGVIFKNEFNVNGLTTAATIWVAAAIGMAMGNGRYDVAIATELIALFVLLLLRFVQEKINGYHQIRVYKLSFQTDKISNKELEDVFLQFEIKYRRLKEFRNMLETTCVYELTGHAKQLDKMNEHLMSIRLIDSFDY